VVYAKPPFGGPESVLKYLVRYAHRVAISNGRLLKCEQSQVTFRWRHSKHTNRVKAITLDAVEFIHRFLLHVLPTGFVKIRYFGFLANRNRAQGLEACRRYLAVPLAANAQTELLSVEEKRAPEHRCPVCQVGRLRIIERLSAEQLFIDSRTTLNCPHNTSLNMVQMILIRRPIDEVSQLPCAWLRLQIH
jgi:hypothetical protein